MLLQAFQKCGWSGGMQKQQILLVLANESDDPVTTSGKRELGHYAPVSYISVCVGLTLRETELLVVGFAPLPHVSEYT